MFFAPKAQRYAFSLTYVSAKSFCGGISVYCSVHGSRVFCTPLLSHATKSPGLCQNNVTAGVTPQQICHAHAVLIEAYGEIREACTSYCTRKSPSKFSSFVHDTTTLRSVTLPTKSSFIGPAPTRTHISRIWTKPPLYNAFPHVVTFIQILEICIQHSAESTKRNCAG